MTRLLWSLSHNTQVVFISIYGGVTHFFPRLSLSISLLILKVEMQSCRHPQARCLATDPAATAAGSRRVGYIFFRYIKVCLVYIETARWRDDLAVVFHLLVNAACVSYEPEKKAFQKATAGSIRSSIQLRLVSYSCIFLFDDARLVACLFWLAISADRHTRGWLMAVDQYGARSFSWFHPHN